MALSSSFFDAAAAASCCSGAVCTCVDCRCPSVLTSTLPEASAAPLADGFAALADPVRLRLVSLLATAADGGACVCDLIAPLGRSQSTVSHHLKVLGDAGLITGDRQGRQIRYSLVEARLNALKTALSKDHVHD
jgi:ArsR family transcriptional regulator, arsenate/arsenite/antimonite-responsive transcriptional repressor